MTIDGKNIRWYLLAALIAGMLLLLLMVKLRPDDTERVDVFGGDYKFTPWIGDKDQWLRQDDSNDNFELSIIKEIQTIKAHRPADEKVADSEEFAVRPEIKTIRFHIVGENDTLSDISQKYYGTSRKWRTIYEANKDTISNPDFLEKGAKLIIPDSE
jgi:hypothetical protein